MSGWNIARINSVKNFNLIVNRPTNPVNIYMKGWWDYVTRIHI